MDMYLKQPVSLNVSGVRLPIQGTLIDLGHDILVLHTGAQFLYVPLVHVSSRPVAPPPKRISDHLPIRL